MPMFRPLACSLTAALAALSSPTDAVAQAYPAKAVRMIVAYPPGGTNDIVARPIAQRLSELLGQPVVVENRGGASGNIGTEMVARAAPDGYTVLMAAGAVTIAPSIYPDLTYDIVKDFAPVSLAARGGFVLLVHPAVPARTVKEFIALAKSRPGALNYASAGTGAPPYLAAVLFQTMTRTRMAHIPYKGGTQPLTDLAGGQVDVYFGGIASANPFIQSGRVRAIAVTTQSRWVLMPELPTMDESGLKGFDVATFFGLMAPAGTPAEVASRLNAAMVQAVATPGVRKTMLAAGVAPETSTSEQFAALIQQELRKFAAIVKSAGASRTD
ncbi:MAG: tripartite tricarboxylate transporter substrate binding protein [Burkholderiales bacterium]|nr:tripartite tricarboxylate transporter substrate binding protein [Burkholderiales bacterium]